MRLPSLALLALLCLAGPLWGQPAASLKLPAEVRGDPAAFVRVAAETEGKHVQWLPLDAGLNVFPTELLRDTKVAVVTAARPGRYRLAAWTAAGDVPSPAAVCLVVVGEAPPVPPTPPGPEPGPTPPTPGGPPLPQDGQLRVMVLYESGDLPKYPPGQQAALYGAAVRSYLNSHCPAAPNGIRDWAFWDQNVDSSAAPAHLRDTHAWLRAQPGFKVPVVTLRKGQAHHTGPLPATAEEFLALLKKYGGD